MGVGSKSRKGIHGDQTGTLKTSCAGTIQSKQIPKFLPIGLGAVLLRLLSDAENVMHKLRKKHLL